MRLRPDPAWAPDGRHVVFTSSRTGVKQLFVLDAKMMGQLLREIESEVLIDALKGLSEEEREPFFAAMSSRAAFALTSARSNSDCISAIENTSWSPCDQPRRTR